MLTSLFTLLYTPLKLSAATTIKREFRAVWVSTVYCLDWPTTSGGNALQGLTSTIVTQQKARLGQILDSMKIHGFNAIFFQVRPMSDALYKSTLEPISSYLTGIRGSATSWDPLEYAISEAHKRGLELHAWVNPYRWAGSATVDWNTTWDNEIKAKGWILTSEKGKILNPGLVDVRNHIVNVCKEIITKYNVDGLVFDDYFYNSGTPEDNTAGDYTLYKKSGTSLSMADWRRNNVNEMVKAVYTMVQENKPYIRFGISPAGVASKGAAAVGITAYSGASDWQYDGIYSDPLTWLSKGIIDYISPQLYWSTTNSTNPFGPLTNWWSKTAAHFHRHHYASHSISSLTNTSTITDWAQYATQIQLSRNYTINNAPGCVLFRTGFISGPNAMGLGHYLQTTKFVKFCLSPIINWKKHDTYGMVSSLNLSGATLSWTGIDDAPVKYSVYAIPNEVSYTSAFRSDGDGISSDYLLGVCYGDSYTLPVDKTSGYGYAVCILDGYGTEYTPQTLLITGVNTLGNDEFAMKVNGHQISFSLTAESVKIFNLSGICVESFDHIDEAELNLPEGLYIMKAKSQRGSIITSRFILH